MHSSTVLLLSLLSSAFAFQVTSPGQRHSWTNNGPQTVSWQRVSTDATQFALILTNENRSLMPDNIVLASNVDAVSANTLNVSPPSSGWPAPGSGYRVNMVRSATDENTIYAQSTEFDIVTGPASVSNSPSGAQSGATTTPGNTSGGTPGSSGSFGAAGARPPASTTGQTNNNTTENGTSGTSQDELIAPGNGASSSVSSLSTALLTGVMALIGASTLL